MKALEKCPVAGRVICLVDGNLVLSQIPVLQWLDSCGDMYYITRNAQEIQQKTPHKYKGVCVHSTDCTQWIHTHLPNLKVVRNTHSIKKSFCWLSQFVVKDNFSRIFKYFFVVLCSDSVYFFIYHWTSEFLILEIVLTRNIRPKVKCTKSCHVDYKATFKQMLVFSQWTKKIALNPNII